MAEPGEAQESPVRPGQRKARGVHVRPAPRVVEPWPGVIVTIDRLNEHGPYGFHVVHGTITFAAFDCEWTPEDAEARAIRAVIVRLGLE